MRRTVKKRGRRKVIRTWRVNMKATGLELRQRCVKEGFEPKVLSEWFGVALTTPYMWFNGEAMPKLNTLVTLAKVLHCKVDDLLIVEEEEDDE